MAGDWIPIRKDLDRSREVSILVEQTQLNVNEVVGQLVRFWSWVDGETADGWLPGATERTLEIASAICPQLVRSMSAVKWIEVREDGIQVINFDNWFGQNAKRRLTDAKRKRFSRLNQQQIEQSAQRPQLVRRTSRKNVTTEEKRREENKERNIPRDLLFESLAEVCGVDWHVCTDEQRGALNQTAGILRRNGNTPDQVRIFREWWDRTHWKGRQKQAPTPAEVREAWGQAFAERKEIRKAVIPG